MGNVSLLSLCLNSLNHLHPHSSFPNADHSQAGVDNFVFISAAGSQHVHLLLQGYWKGKQKAEAAILRRLVF